MDLPRKRSNKYVTAVYAIFIILFAFTATLFYASRCQESGRLVPQDDDIRKSRAAAENPQIVTNKIYITKEPSQNKTAAFKSNTGADDESFNVQPSKKESTAEKKTNIDDSKTASGKALSPSADPVPTQTAAISSGEKAEIYFAKDSTGLTNEALEQLNAIAEFLLKFPDAEIIVRGYGDSHKKYRHNTKLSKLRADVVKSYLIRHGTASARIKAFWIGSENPAAENDPQQDPNKTHLVEIKFKMKSKADLKN